MQIFPTNSSAAQISEHSANPASFAREENGFAGLLANYMEEGREEYCGRPPGFSALEENRGTLSNREGEQFIKALRKRNVDEDSIAALEPLLQSGQGLTIGAAFKALDGAGARQSDQLEDQERDAFKMLLAKMGLPKDNVDELLAMSDDAQGAKLLQGLRQALGSMDGSVDVTRDEFSSMLRALDLSNTATEKIMQLFGDKESATLNGAEAQALLVEAGKDLARKSGNARHAQQHMREAMNEALAEARVEEQAGRVDSNRGDRRSEWLKAFMEDTVLGKTGAYDVKQDTGGQGEGFADGRNASHLWRELARDTEKGGERSKASRLLHNVGFAGGLHEAQDMAAQARNLDIANRGVEKEIFAQVEQGILQNARNGSQRLTLQLQPEELGKLNLVLTMKQGELKASIIAENAESAALLNEQMAELKAALEEQGIKVAELQVRTETEDRRFGEQWSGQNEHNEMTDRREHDRLMRLSRVRREEGADSGPAETARRASQIISQGLHIVA